MKFITSFVFISLLAVLVILSSFLSKPEISNLNFTQFKASVDKLQTEGLLDGEIFIAQGEEPLFHCKSRDLSQDGYMIGAVSKQFFAAALLKTLYEQSSGTDSERIEQVKAKLQKPVCTYLPKTHEIWGKALPEWTHKVNLHHLLSHTSGIADYTYAYPSDFYASPHKPQEIIQAISAKELLFTPGTSFAYSETNYLLISQLLAALTGKSNSELLQEIFFEPLQMSSTFNMGHGTDSPSLTPQYQYDPSNPQNLYKPSFLEDLSHAQGSGSLVSTAHDLHTWNLALHKYRIILPEPLYELFIEENLDGYAYGITNDATPLGTLLGHNGSIASYRALLCYLPDHDITLIVLTHISPDQSLFYALLQSLDPSLPPTEKTNMAYSQVLGKYPPTRGYDKIISLLYALIN